VPYKFIITILISATFLLMAVWNFKFEEFVNVMKDLNPLYILPALGCYLFSFVFRTLRWKIMMRSVQDIKMRSLFSYIVIGYMANNLLPARLGEVVRAYVTGKKEGMSRSSAFASVILERLFDGLTIVMILVILMFATDLDKAWLRYMAWTGVLLFAGALAFLFGLAYQRKRFLKLSEAVTDFLPQKIASKIMHILRRFVRGLKLLHAPKDFFLSIFISFLVWACEVMVYKIYLVAFNIDVPFQAALLALVVVNLSMLIPSSPGGIGVFQFACKQSLAVFAVGATTSITWSVAIHSTQIIPITILGLILMTRLGFSMHEISHVELDENGNGNNNVDEKTEALAEQS